MQPARTPPSIGLGFLAIAGLFFAIVAIWLAMVSNHNANLRRLHQGESQRQLIFTMRDAAHERNLALFRMVSLQDVFKRDDEYLLFKESAGHFIAARQQLLGKHLNTQTAANWQKLKPLIQRSETLQNAIVERIMEDNNGAALRLIQQEYIPLQRRVARELSRMLDSARDDITTKLNTASAATQTQYHIILLLVLVATVIGYMIAKTVTRRSHEAHNVLLNKNRQIHAINAAISKPHTAIEEQIDIILRLGCELLPMEQGMLIKSATGQTATAIDRYPKSLALTKHDEQTLTQAVREAVGDDNALLITDSSPGVEQRLLRELMDNLDMSRIVAAPLNISGPAEHYVIFWQTKNIPLSGEARELLQLLSDKLVVLLEQKETLFQLDHARLAAETANKAKNVFLANITDELQTPLRSIMDQNAALHDKLRLHQHLDCADELDEIDTASGQLRSLISNLLDMSQLESGSMVLEYRPVEMEPLLQDIKHRLEPVITKGDNQFESHILNELGTIHADPDRISQVLANLISFAGKITRHGKISLTAWREPTPEGDWLYLEVQDTGNGISKKQRNQLFKLTFADSPEQNKSAIGPEATLAISKKICERLGGDILVESAPDHGTTFTICLPCLSHPPKEIAAC